MDEKNPAIAASEKLKEERAIEQCKARKAQAEENKKRKPQSITWKRLKYYLWEGRMIGWHWIAYILLLCLGPPVFFSFALIMFPLWAISERSRPKILVYMYADIESTDPHKSHVFDYVSIPPQPTEKNPSILAKARREPVKDLPTKTDGKQIETSGAVFREGGPFLRLRPSKKIRLSSRPGKRDTFGTFDVAHMATEDLRDIFAPFGFGPEYWYREPVYSLWRFYVERTYAAFDFYQGMWSMLERQGLQVLGCLSAIVIFLLQLEMMVEDYNHSDVQAYRILSAASPQGSNLTAQTDKSNQLKCAYFPGTGIANWGEGLENIAWYFMYHIMLRGFYRSLATRPKEDTDISLSCPVILLVCATLSTSQIYFIHTGPAVELRYLLLMIPFFVGTYQVLAQLCIYVITIEDRPDSPLTQKRWDDWQLSERDDFREDVNLIEDPFFTVRWQAKVGDQCRMLKQIPWKDYRADPWGWIQRVEKERCWMDKVREQGQMYRQFWHGWPIPFPPISLLDAEHAERGDPETKPNTTYYGIADWHPNYKLEGGKDRNYTYFWCDVKRMMAIIVASSLWIIHCVLIYYQFGGASQNTYRTQYDATYKQWQSSGLSKSDCAYYAGSYVPILILQQSSLSGVAATLAWLAMWHVFLMGMCAGVIFVCFSNHRMYGMHFPIFLTLIGPRLSSNGIGWTIGMVSFSTLQLGFFYRNSSGIVFARYIGYAGVSLWVLYLIVNEDQRNTYIRNPFIKPLSVAAMKSMDHKKFWRERVEYDHPM